MQKSDIGVPAGPGLAFKTLSPVRQRLVKWFNVSDVMGNILHFTIEVPQLIAGTCRNREMQ